MNKEVTIFRLILIIILLSSNSHAVKAYDVNDIILDTISPSRLNLKGKVKLFKEFIYYAIDNNGNLQTGKMAKDSNFVVKPKYDTNRCYIFDLDGRNIQKNEYWSPSEVLSIQKMTYQNKRLTQTNIEFHFSDGIRHAKTIFNYNEKGQIISYVLYNIYGKLASKRLFKYDDHDNIIWEREVDGDGEINETNTSEYKYEGNKMIYSYSKEEEDGYITINKWTYDSSGKEIGSYYQWGDLVWDSKYEFDTDGKIIKKICKDAEGKTKYITTLKYNENGLLQEKVERFSNGRCKTSIFDNEKRTETITETKDDVLVEKAVYVDNNLMEYYDGKNSYEYKYTFDSKGNWIKAIEEKNSIPTYIKQRTIQYFQ